tara:strand:- start:522 stop:785 length:264 start_codon:yes stop_codon:yes gene_type:complete
MKHPLFGDDYPEAAPDFAILQNSRTHQTHLWTRERGKWFKAGEDEYDILKGIADLIRVSEYPDEVLKGLKFAAEEKNNELDNDEDLY